MYSQCSMLSVDIVIERIFDEMLSIRCKHSINLDNEFSVRVNTLQMPSQAIWVRVLNENRNLWNIIDLITTPYKLM